MMSSQYGQPGQQGFVYYDASTQLPIAPTVPNTDSNGYAVISSPTMTAIFGLQQTQTLETFQNILVELRTISSLLQSGLAVQDDLDVLRNDNQTILQF